MDSEVSGFGVCCVQIFFNYLLPIAALGIFGWLCTPDPPQTSPEPKSAESEATWRAQKAARQAITIRQTGRPMTVPTPRTLMEVMIKTRPHPGAHRPLSACAAAASGFTRAHMLHNVDCDEVYPNIYVGNESSARNIQYLKSIGVSHVLNAAEGTQIAQICTGEDYYRAAHIQYLGLLLHDVPTANIAKYFDESCRFIDEALTGGGKVLVHCFMGVSRSATLVIAYLMMHKGMNVEEALRTVRQRRAVGPNQGFLQQLCDLQAKLNAKSS